MKNLIALICLTLFSFNAIAQETYTINNETLELKTEVDGELDLLWNIIDNHYRYFVKQADNNIQELVNTKDENKKYQEEYKTVLKSLTQNSSLSVEKVDLTLYSLRTFIDSYNSLKDSNYTIVENAKLKSRLGIFGGCTNNPFVINPNNEKTTFFGAEFEIYSDKKMKRHAGFFGIRHALETDDFKYSETELSIGYRFRFVNSSRFSMYANLKLVTYTFVDRINAVTGLKENTSGIEAPFIFGLGADVRISKNSYITLNYHDMYAAFIDNNDNFPVDLSIGFKTNL